MHLPMDEKKFAPSQLLLLETSVTQREENSNSVSPAQQLQAKYNNVSVSPTRVAIIIPYTGQSLPVWFNTFVLYAQFSSHLIDWFIFVTNEQFSNMSTPVNVNVIYLPLSEFYERMLSVDSQFVDADVQTKHYWRVNFDKCVEKYPYLVVEFKPCLGYIFQDYLTDYSHWGYADVDILLGRSTGFLTKQLLRSFDVYTSSFGDVSRMYLRGQFAVFQKSYQLLHLWRKCSYFEHLTDRIALALKTGNDGRVHGWRFESAEGCISHAAFTGQTNISTYVASTQISDAFRAPLHNKEAFFLGNTLMRCYEKPIEVTFGKGKSQNSLYHIDTRTMALYLIATYNETFIL